jgi:peptide/nickel transport system ATP-binding protein
VASSTVPPVASTLPPSTPSKGEADSEGAAVPLADVVLDVRGLRTYFYTYDGVVRALDGVKFKIRRGETLGLVGETGCGKSVTAFSITRLIPDPPGRVMEGKVFLHGSNLLWRVEDEAKYKEVRRSGRYRVRRKYSLIRDVQRRMMAVRGSKISVIFQEPMLALNPVFPIHEQIAEALTLHRFPAIITPLLEATPDVALANQAIDRLGEAAQRRDVAAMRAAAEEVGRTLGRPSLGTEAFHVARSSEAASSETIAAEVRRRIGRVRLSGSQRSYLKLRLRMAQIDQQLRDVYLQEMREGTYHRGERRLLGGRRRGLQLQALVYSLPGLKRHVQRPMKDELFWHAVELLEDVTIANPAQVARAYPHELSGGMLQRVMIAMALSSEPEILIADEPTTALDVTIQAQILELMRDLKHRIGTAILLITHDLGVIAEVADRVCVMYAGHIIETAPVKDLYARPLHPYTQGLLASIPRLDDPNKRLDSIPGSVPDLIRPPSGCRFHPRCPYAMPVCKEKEPPTTVEGPYHTVACFLYSGPEDVS